MSTRKMAKKKVADISELPEPPFLKQRLDPFIVCSRQQERIQNILGNVAGAFLDASFCPGQVCYCIQDFNNLPLKRLLEKELVGRPGVGPSEPQTHSRASLSWVGRGELLPGQPAIDSDLPTTIEGVKLFEKEVPEVDGDNCFIHDIHDVGHRGMRHVHVMCNSMRSGLVEDLARIVNKIYRSKENVTI